jgi:4-hydroxy-4-methyl-2-oxoglutarate aldolase
MTTLATELIAALKRLDTCTVCNAIESLGVRLNNEGFANSSIRCLTASTTPLVGYAATVRIRCSNPPREGRLYVDRTDWWSSLADITVPHVVVIQDVDEAPGLGSFIGEAHANILLALGCVGAVTNGSVRALPKVRQTPFQMFARSVSVSHAFSHIVDFGKPVEIGGLCIQPGDLLHADTDGVLSIPSEIASRVPEAAARVIEQKRHLVEFCHSPQFSIDRLRDAVKGIYH